MCKCVVGVCLCVVGVVVCVLSVCVCCGCVSVCVCCRFVCVCVCCGCVWVLSVCVCVCLCMHACGGLGGFVSVRRSVVVPGDGCWWAFEVSLASLRELVDSTVFASVRRV